MSRLVEWVQPYDTKKDSPTMICSMTEQDAIKAQRRSGLIKKFQYVSDEQALEDFMVIHWQIMDH